MIELERKNFKEALAEGNTVCIHFINPNADDGSYMLVRPSDEMLIKVLSAVVDMVDYIGEPTEQMPFSYAVNLFCFSQSELERMSAQEDALANAQA